jgi:hypothetical protein
VALEEPGKVLHSEYSSHLQETLALMMRISSN